MNGRRALFLLSFLFAFGATAEAYAQQGGRGGEQAYAPDPVARARIHTELGALYFQDGNMAVALEELQIALDADPGYAPAYNVRGLVRTHLREMDAAEEDFRKALRLAPNDPEVNNNYGWFLCQTGKERQSIAYFLNALKNPLYSTPDRAYANAGTCALKAGDLEGAEGYLRQAIRLSPDGGAAARLQLAQLHYRRGDLEAARRQVGDLLKTESVGPDVLWLALRIERKLGNSLAESGFAARLRSRYPASPEYQEFLKGNFE